MEGELSLWLHGGISREFPINISETNTDNWETLQLANAGRKQDVILRGTETNSTEGYSEAAFPCQNLVLMVTLVTVVGGEDQNQELRVIME